MSKRIARGDSWKKAFYHVLRRSFLLLAFGFMLGADKNGFSLTNVLAQLSFTYLVAFLLMEKDFKWQLAVSFAMIILSDVIYRIWSVDGFNQPFTADHNFGSWVDMAITGKLSERQVGCIQCDPYKRPYYLGCSCRKAPDERFSAQKEDTYTADPRNNSSYNRILHEPFHSYNQTDLHKFFYNRQRRLLPYCHGILILAH